ncbi:MAG TPA: sigma-70 family RNA polymerase sigma factor [Vicinamibacteria bacterium]
MSGLSLPRETDPTALARRVQAGDRSAEDELVLVLQEALGLFLRRRLRDIEAARELTSDVLMAVLRALRENRLQDIRKLPAFVRGTARNLANNHLRARFARPAEEPLLGEPAADSVAEGFEQQERAARVEAAISRLTRSERQIVLMTIEDGLKPGEIARDLGLSPEAVRARKSRALRKLMANARAVGLAGALAFAEECSVRQLPGSGYAAAERRRGFQGGVSPPGLNDDGQPRPAAISVAQDAAAAKS